jgi:hypothetical protein
MRLGLHAHPTDLTAANYDPVLNLEGTAFHGNTVQFPADPIPVFNVYDRNPLVYRLR